MKVSPSSRHVVGTAVAAALLLLGLAACSGGSSSTSSSSQPSATGSPVSGGTVSYALPPSTTTNWIFPMGSLAYFSVYNSFYLQQQLYRPLYWFGGHNDQATVDYGLSAAKQPQYAADGKSVTVALKPWKWSNGESVNADDVIFWINMLKVEKKNWPGYVPGDFPDNVTKVTKVNDSTVKFSLTQKFSNLWFTYNELSQITPMPMAWDVTSLGAKPGSGGCTQDQSKCKAVYDFLTKQSKDQKTYATSKLWGVVNGPWKLGSYSSAGQFTLVPNKSYSGSPKPRLDSVKFLPFTSDSSEYNVLKSGTTVDVGTVPKQDLPQKPAGASVPTTNPLGSGYSLTPQYAWQFNYFIPNFNNPDVGPMFKQLYVRQALQMTLNQPLGIQKAQKGYGYETISPVPTKPKSQFVSPAAQKGNPYPFSISKTKALLTSHGWSQQGGVMTCTKPGSASNQCGSGISKGKKMTFAMDVSSGNTDVSQQMQQYKSDAAKAGIQMNVKEKPFNSVSGEAIACKPSQSSCGWQIANYGGWLYAPDYLPTGELLFQTGAGSNPGSYSDPKMDKLIQASKTQNGLQPFYAYEDYAMQQLPYIWTSGTYEMKATSTKVGGVNFNPLLTIVPEYWYRTK